MSGFLFLEGMFLDLTRMDQALPEKSLPVGMACLYEHYANETSIPPGKDILLSQLGFKAYSQSKPLENWKHFPSWDKFPSSKRNTTNHRIQKIFSQLGLFCGSTEDALKFRLLWMPGWPVSSVPENSSWMLFFALRSTWAQNLSWGTYTTYNCSEQLRLNGRE